jgi:chorismate synthase
VPAIHARYDSPMSHNTFGHLFRVTTFGESHGVAIGCVVDGCPPLIPLTEADIQRDLDRRRPGQSRFTTQRQEPDTVKILSGVMAHPETGVQVTTGTPIALLIENTDQRSKDYSDIKDKFRPLVGARDRDAGCGRGHRAQDLARGERARRAGADGPAQDRPR